MEKQKRVILWFRNDLRLLDNEVLHKALAHLKTQTVANLVPNSLIPVFCFDPRWFEETSLGFSKTGAYRAQFMCEAVANLRNNLRQIGSDLVIAFGKPEEVLTTMAEQWQVSWVFAAKEVGTEEIYVENQLEQALWKQKTTLELFWHHTLVHPDDLPFPINNLPNIFTEFRKEVEKNSPIRPFLPSPKQLPPLKGIDTGDLPTWQTLGLEEPTSDGRQVLAFKGGETAALARLEDYFWKNRHLSRYKETRDGLLGESYSSKFSAWLSMGCLSARYVYAKVKHYEQEIARNQSTYWLVFELLWRDYFRWVARKFGRLIFSLGGIQQNTSLKYSRSQKLFESWRLGNTGIPFIDANMRELLLTGFMSNRGRQNVASFLCKDLQVDWTWGAMWFESALIDYDVCSNWGNWNYVAGVGNDPRENRYFNILTQAKRYDYEGAYVKHWLPELEQIPAKKVHNLSELSPQEQKKYALILGKDYPKPLVRFEKRVS